jgi:hypothetical protein
MKYTLIFICSALLNSRILTMNKAVVQKHQQPVNWDSTLHWKIYKLAAFKTVFRISTDSLAYFESRPLNDDSVHYFLNGVSKLSGGHDWMGCYLVSYELPDHSVRKAIISQYGGFFYAPQDHAFYQIEDTQQKDWLEYLSDKYVTMSSKIK